MQLHWIPRMARLGAVLTVVGVLSIGASEALAAESLRARAACEENTNWCAEGQDNCDRCCNNGELGGFCTSMEPGTSQGCICYS